MTEIRLGVDVLKQVLERLPQNYAVAIQINNTVFSANTFDIDDDEEEICIKWCDLDYTVSQKDKVRIEDIRHRLKELQEENKQLKQQLDEMITIFENNGFDYHISDELNEILKGDDV